MIVSQKFVWAHVPKTGGDATAAMIRQVPRLIELADPAGDRAKHLSFDQRRGSIRGKLLVANMRRLPSWAVSYVDHLRHFGQWPDYEPQAVRGLDVVATESAADNSLNRVVGDYEIDIWIRQEYLADDLVAFLRDVADLTRDEEEAIRSVGRVNASPSRFGRPAWSYRRAQTKRLYEANPRWAAIEKRVYG